MASSNLKPTKNPTAPDQNNSEVDAGFPLMVVAAKDFNKPFRSLRLNSKIKIYVARKNDHAKMSPNVCIGNGMFMPSKSWSASDRVGYMDRNY